MQKILAFCAAAITICGTLSGLNFTRNQEQVLTQLDLITNPTVDQLNVIEALIQLSVPKFKNALDQMSGEQYANLMQIDIKANQRFLRRLYDPIRLYNTGFRCCRVDCLGIEPWIQADWGRSLMRSDHNAKGFKDHHWDISVGVQSCLTPCWIVGAAGDYSFDRLDYDLPGHSSIRTGLGALYGAYLLPDCYILADLMGGYSHGKITRRIHFGNINREARGTSRIANILGYGEMGANFCAGCLFIQPFVAFESAYYHLNHLREHDGSSLNLGFNKKHITTFDTRVGAHFTTWLYGIVSINVDFAWQHRFNAIGDKVGVHFEEFGQHFTIRGPRQDRDGIIGAVNAMVLLCDWLTVFGEFSGENWARYSTWSVTGGMQAFF